MNNPITPSAEDIDIVVDVDVDTEIDTEIDTGIDTGIDAGDSAGIDYFEVAHSPEFRTLKRRHTSFVVPFAIFFLAWYFAYVIFAAFRPDLMAIPVFGVINLGLLLGLGQFVTTFAITMGYVAFANRRLDPLAASIRESLEAKEQKA